MHRDSAPSSARLPRTSIPFGMLQDGGPHGAARDLPGAECVAASALSGRLVVCFFLGAASLGRLRTLFLE